MALGRVSLSVTVVQAWLVLSVYQLPCQSPVTPSGKPARHVQSPNGLRAEPAVGQVEVFNGSSRWAGDLSSGLHPEVDRKSSRSESAVSTVDVINGSARRTQVFDEEQRPAPPQARSNHKKNAKGLSQSQTTTTPDVPEVEIINGARWETRRFEGAEDEITTPWIERRNTQPVVIGVTSTESARRRGITTATASTAPIVVGIASSESKGHGENAKPIAYRIAPGLPRRPPYRPGPPGF